MLTTKENMIGLMAFNREILEHADCLDFPDSVVIDINSGESPILGW